MEVNIKIEIAAKEINVARIETIPVLSLPTTAMKFKNANKVTKKRYAKN
jgi:hypothetical protein